MEGYDTNLAHLKGELLAANLLLHRQILRWRASHPNRSEPDELLGLVMSDGAADSLLDDLYQAQAPPDADSLDQAPLSTINSLLRTTLDQHLLREERARQSGVDLKLVSLVERLHLTPYDRQIVVLALAGELDGRYARLFGYLNDDLTLRCPTVELLLQMLGNELEERTRQRERFLADAPLIRHRVVYLEEPSPTHGPAILRPLRLDSSIVSFLLGTERADPSLESVRIPLPAVALTLESRPQERLLQRYLARATSPRPIICFAGPDNDLQLAIATRVLTGYDVDKALLILDGKRLAEDPRASDRAARACREARLHHASIVVSRADLMSRGSEPGRQALAHLLTERLPRATVLTALAPWPNDGLPADLPVLNLRLDGPDVQERRQLWRQSLNGMAADVDLRQLSERFEMTKEQIERAAGQARQMGLLRGEGETRQVDLLTAARNQAGSELGDLAQKVSSIHSWDDLIVPAGIKAQLRALEDWVIHRHKVYQDWGFAQRIMMGNGLSVLFSGPSGTGKTMAAGILARQLALDLYRIDLSTVVSKYIGETEKNLSRIFAAAQTASAILFFDEADALFGKRSEVKDSHDRYANIEVSYLLQRMEEYSGIAILATNFRQNLDQAFARRLQVTIDFPLPNVSDRERIWRRLLPSGVPLSDDIDLAFLARQFALSGGNIKNCVLAAAFAAAASSGLIEMRHLVRAVARELEKMDRPVVRNSFGEYHEFLRGD